MAVTERVEKIRASYVDTRPHISYERAWSWTKSFRRTEGQPHILRTAQAFRDTCGELPVEIWEGELIVGTSGEYRRCAILTPEFGWTWIEEEIDTFPEREQDPYDVTPEQIRFIKENIFPYWKGRSVEEAFLSRIPEDTKRIGVDTGFLDTDSKWRNGIGEISADYIDQLLPKGFGGIRRETEAYMAALDAAVPADRRKLDFYRAILLICDGMICLGHRYAERARTMAETEPDEKRRAELLEIAAVCDVVPEKAPETFREAIQFVWFVQLGGILAENPLAWNPGRFDQYMFPYYERDLEAGRITRDEALELIELLWLKYSEWAWTISKNTASFFAGYTNFENLTIGGTRVDGSDGTNEISYLAIEATRSIMTHQPTLSCRIQPDCPPAFMEAVTELVSTGCGFPAIHSDRTGYQMLSNLGYDPIDARDWNNCGCVVPHSRKTFQWTSACTISFASALEFALNEGRSRLTGQQVSLPERDPRTFASYEELLEAWKRQFRNLVRHGVISLVTAQEVHREIGQRPFMSACNESCLRSGADLVDGGAKYNIGPVFTGVGLSVTANSLAVIKRLVYEEKVTTLAELVDALDADWVGYEALRQRALACPKYGNDEDYVDLIARDLADFYRQEVVQYKDLYGAHFVTAFMGISNYLPTGRVLGATPDGRHARDPINEGVSPVTGTDTATCLAALRSAAKMKHDMHSGGTLLNLRLDHQLVATKRGRANLGAMLQSYFALGGFHVQFNTISNEVLSQAQRDPDRYRSLLVRVAGYSAQFTNLSKEMQDSIMARNAHEEF